MLTIKAAQKAFTQTPRKNRKSGVAAEFAKVNKRWGVKCYLYEKIRDKTYRMQEHAAQFGLAPKVGPKFKVDDGGLEMFGYVTECVKCLMSETSVAIWADWAYSEKAKYFIGAMADAFGLTDYNWHSLRYDWDLHRNNVGFMADGRLVCIDFSEMSIDVPGYSATM